MARTSVFSARAATRAVDVNGTWDADTAIQTLKRWRPYDVYWLEEPCPPDDFRGYLAVKKRAGDTYIVGGEQLTGMLEFRTMLEQGGVDIIQPGMGMVGGITEWLRVYRLATEFGVPVSPWQTQAVNIHTCAGLPNVKWIEYFPPGKPHRGLPAPPLQRAPLRRGGYRGGRLPHTARQAGTRPGARRGVGGANAYVCLACVGRFCCAPGAADVCSG
jgi:L-alanine-DL-glutamate epimerase-like enolase superfamily enzyme